MAAALLVLGTLLLAACAAESDHLGPTTTTTIFPSQRSFEEELSGDGYGPPFLFVDGQGAAKSLVVWIAVDTSNESRATDDAIFDHAVALAENYEATNSTGGRMTVGLFDPKIGGSVKDNIFESRDFDLTATAGSTGVDPSDGARVVQEYFAAEGARFVQGILVKDVRVNDESRGRTLSLTFVSDTSGKGGDFDSLYYGSVGEDGWTAELNQAGLNLAWVRMEFVYQDGWSETLEVDIARHGIAGSTRLRPGPPTTHP